MIALHPSRDKCIDWGAVLSLSCMHLGAVIGVVVLVSGWALGTSLIGEICICLALVYVRMFGITAGFHRYFAHHSYRTSRWFQFVLALIGSSAAQWGPLKWAALHRHHHRYSDKEGDIHSVRQEGFWESHMLWIIRKKNASVPYDKIRDFARYWELRLIDKLYYVPPALLGVACWLFGGWRGLFVYFFLSTVILYHLTYSINSLMHLIGKKVYETPTHDDSKNSFLLALLTWGEGWHNNHHYYPSSERQGFLWWQIDITHYLLTILSWCGIVWDLRSPPPEKI